MKHGMEVRRYLKTGNVSDLVGRGCYEAHESVYSVHTSILFLFHSIRKASPAEWGPYLPCGLRTTSINKGETV